MKIPEQGVLVRIYIGESDRWHGQPLYEAIVQLARKMGMAGATVFRGFLGFGAHSRLHSTRLLRLSEDLPIMIEIVDSKEKVDALISELDGMIQEGLITKEEVQVVKYRADPIKDEASKPNSI